jgi:hypothetical protein
VASNRVLYNKSQINPLNFSIGSGIKEIFNVTAIDNALEYMLTINVLTANEVIPKRKESFLQDTATALANFVQYVFRDAAR